MKLTLDDIIDVHKKISKNEVDTLLVLSGHKRFSLNSWEKDKRHWLVSV